MPRLALIWVLMLIFVGTHISPELCQMSQKAIKHTQWYVQTVQNAERDTSEAPLLTRLMRDLRNRNQGKGPKNRKKNFEKFLKIMWPLQRLLFHEQVGVWSTRHSLYHECAQFWAGWKVESGQSYATNFTTFSLWNLSAKFSRLERSNRTRYDIKQSSDDVIIL